jgi:hypothetical protein
LRERELRGLSLPLCFPAVRLEPAENKFAALFSGHAVWSNAHPSDLELEALDFAHQPVVVNDRRDGEFENQRH